MKLSVGLPVENKGWIHGEGSERFKLSKDRQQAKYSVLIC